MGVRSSWETRQKGGKASTSGEAGQRTPPPARCSSRGHDRASRGQSIAGHLPQSQARQGDLRSTALRSLGGERRPVCGQTCVDCTGHRFSLPQTLPLGPELLRPHVSSFRGRCQLGMRPGGIEATMCFPGHPRTMSLMLGTLLNPLSRSSLSCF